MTDWMKPYFDRSHKKLDHILKELEMLTRADERRKIREAVRGLEKRHIRLPGEPPPDELYIPYFRVEKLLTDQNTDEA